MHTEYHSARLAKWIPPFALDTAKLRTVLVFRGWMMAYGPKRFNSEIPYAVIDAAATERSLHFAENNFVDTARALAHTAAVRRAGSYLSLQGAIAYRAWRLGQNSIDIGDALGISPVNVRVSLERLKRCARALGYDVGKNHHTYRVRKPYRQKRYGRSLDGAVEMYARGMNVNGIAIALGFAKSSGRHRIAQHLRDAGVYRPQPKK
jgi:hypothetical protein